MDVKKHKLTEDVKEQLRLGILVYQNDNERWQQEVKSRTGRGFKNAVTKQYADELQQLIAALDSENPSEAFQKAFEALVRVHGHCRIRSLKAEDMKKVIKRLGKEIGLTAAYVRLRMR